MKRDFIFNLKEKLLRWVHCIAGWDCILCHREILACDQFSKQFDLPLCQCCYEELLRERLGVLLTKENYDILALFEYKGLAKKLIREAKFHHCPFAARILIEIANDFFLPSSEGKRLCFVPVPCSVQSKRERGWDPVTLWAKKGCSQAKNALFLPLLKRKRSQLFQPQQKKLNRKERIQKANSRYTINKNLLKKANDSKNLSFSFILLDDVMTTGATIRETVKKLEAFSPSVWVLCVD